MIEHSSGDLQGYSMGKLSIALCWLLLVNSSVVSGSSLYNIAPSKNDSSCLSDSNCIAFKTFLRGTSSYIASNMVFRFYPAVYSSETTSIDPGRHRIIISGLTNITIDGRITSEHLMREKAKIVCTKDFKVLWMILRCANVNIRNIEMVDCVSIVRIDDVIRGEVWSTRGWQEFALLTVDTRNISIEYFQASTEKGYVLFSVNTEERLSITHSKVEGVVQLLYTEKSPTATFLYIGASLFHARRLFNYDQNLNEVVALKVELQHDNINPISLTVFNTTFQGLEDECGYSLDVTSSVCNEIKVNLLDVKIIYGGIQLSNSGWTCEDRLRNTAYITNTQFIGMCSQTCFPNFSLRFSSPIECGLTMVAYYPTMVNSTISNSMKGIQMIKSAGSVMNSTFINSSNAISCEISSSIVFSGKNYFTDNKQGNTTGYSSIYIVDSSAIFEDETVFENNNGGYYGAFVAYESTIYFRAQSKTIFSGNQGFYGGAMSLYSFSILNIDTTAMLVFNSNRAWKNGGAIYADKQAYISPSSFLKDDYQCFFYSSDFNHNVFTFCNNTAIQGGEAIYSESLYHCYMKQSTTDKITRENKKLKISNFLKMITSCNPETPKSLLSSDPAYICFCNLTHTECTDVERYMSIIPGQTIELSVIAMSLIESPVQATAQARFHLPHDYNAGQSLQCPYISQQQARQILLTTCTTIEYTIYTPEGNQTLIIATRELYNEYISENLRVYSGAKQRYRINPGTFPELPLFLYISVQPCPTGYILNQESLSCECHLYLTRAGIRCLIRNQTVIRSGTVWINATNDTVIIHRYCPLGYCKTQQTELSLTDPSTQCSFQRSGTLCGQCRQNLSQMLGSSDCQECSNLWLLLVIPMTIVSGIVLVIFVMSFNLTVATGTINGLIFYANIIRANNAIYFSTQRYISTRICNVFIAWVNLDVSITMCFYNGLTAYIKTVFQLAFPLYIFTLVAIIIISSHYSTRAARLSGTNAVQVLATLFLLTYSKSVRFVITALQPSTLTIQHYPNNTNATNLVWLYDGNVDYLQGKHIFLFLLGLLILVLVSFPYTTVLILIQCLQRRSHHKCLSWVWKMSPLFDAYTGPYKTKHRYWTGLLLLLRVALFAVFSLNISGDPSINLLATLIVMLLTLGYIAMVGRVYKSKALSVLECFFLLNLTILSASSLFALQTNRDQEVITNISVILSMVLFCGILMLHAYKRIISMRVTKRWMKKVRKQESEEENQDDDNGQMEKNNRIVTRQVVSIKDLEEPLIEMDQIAESNETHELDHIID